MQKLVKAGIFILLLAIVANLSACGKVSAPVPLEGSGYPHSYPHH